LLAKTRHFLTLSPKVLTCLSKISKLKILDNKMDGKIHMVQW
jgi:hypothetical protein